MLKNFILIAALTIATYALSGQSRASWPMISGDPMRTSYTQMQLEFPLHLAQTIHSRHRRAHGICFSEDRVYIGDYATRNTLVAADLSSGDSLWSFALPGTGGGINFIPAVADNVVLVGGQGGQGLYARNATTGDSLWLLPVGTLYGRSAIIVDTMVYVPAPGHFICAGLHSGIVMWSFDGGVLQSPPAADSQNVYFSTYDGLYAMDRLTGDTVWVNDTVITEFFMSLAVDTAHVYAGINRHIVALDRSSGIIAWEFTLAEDEDLVEYPEAYAMTSQYILAKYLKESSAQNQYIVFDKSSGDVLRQFEGGDMFNNGPTIINNTVVEYSNRRLQFYNLLTGELTYELDQIPIDGYVSQIIAMSDKIYIAGDGPDILVFEGEPSGVAEPNNLIDVVLMPNPSSEQVTLRCTLDKPQNLHVAIYTMSGELVQTADTEVLTMGTHVIDLSIDTLLPGMYGVTVRGEDYYGTTKLIITP